MQRPLTGYRVLGLILLIVPDVELACLDEKSNVLHIDVIYPHRPHNDKERSRKKIIELISKYNLNLIAISNGDRLKRK